MYSKILRQINFLVTIESTGILSPIQIFKESIKILKEKCLHHAKFLEELTK